MIFVNKNGFFKAGQHASHDALLSLAGLLPFSLGRPLSLEVTTV
jgi:hypothetical protein